MSLYVYMECKRDELEDPLAPAQDHGPYVASGAPPEGFSRSFHRDEGQS